MHLGDDDPWVDGVDPDPLGRELESAGAGQLIHGRLAHVVRHHAGEGAQTCGAEETSMFNNQWYNVLFSSKKSTIRFNFKVSDFLYCGLILAGKLSSLLGRKGFVKTSFSQDCKVVRQNW